MKQLWTYINILSIDIAAGAALISSVITLSLTPLTPVPVWNFVLLACITWLIFTFDHLADAKKISYPASSQRHRFHQEHFYVLLIVFLFILFTAAGIFFILELYALTIPALFVIGICGIYFLNYYTLKKFRKIFYGKELLIALGFSGGCLVIPASVLIEKNDLFPLIAPAVFLVCIALQNLLLLGIFEKKEHPEERDYSIAWWVSWGKRKFLFFFCGMMAIIAGMIIHVYQSEEFISFYFTIPLWYIALGGLRQNFRSVETARMFTDGAFLLAGVDIIVRLF